MYTTKSELGDVKNGGGYACVVAESIGEWLYFPLNFVVNLKLI